MLLRPLLVALAGALTAAAGPLGPSAFEALAEGHTLTFAHDGMPYGAEQYFPGRRSLWRYPDGTCAGGVWWADGDRVCFRYGEDAPRECWTFTTGPTGISVARVGGEGPGIVLDLERIDETPLDCPGPRVGS